MFCSKLLPPFTFELLYYLNRDQLKRFSIVCRPLKNYIERYFHSKPYRIFDYLLIYGGSYALFPKDVHWYDDVQWHPNQDDSSAQQSSADQQIHYGYEFYSFAEVRPYLDQTVRIKETIIYVSGDSNTTCRT